MNYSHLLFFIFLNLSVGSTQESQIPDAYHLVYEQTFDSPQAWNDFEMTAGKAWRIGENEDGAFLELYGASEYQPPVRSPLNIAILKYPIVGDFVMEAKLAQTGREYGHRDLCLFFGMKDASNFYYAHLASVADDYANNIFLVNDEPRIKIASATTPGTNWGATNSWHTVRIERYVESGAIKVYFDDSKAPIMVAEDQHFKIGRIGFGSFDDTGYFDDIKIWAPETFAEQGNIFAKNK